MSTRGASSKGQERREAVLDAAERLLVDEGHGALTMRGVAQRAGIRLGNLQYYFPTSEELVQALLARVLERATARLEERMGLAGNPAEALDAALDSLLEDQLNPDSYRLFYDLWALAAREPAIAAELRAFYARYVDRTEELLVNAAPGLPRAEARVRAELLVALLEGLSLFRSGTVGAPDKRVEAGLRRMVSGLIAGSVSAQPRR
ncbi:TetR/AcrR family transcriptional regulator [Archangium lansingense]|uniref:TetR family transcriptional regulator C-terminal domain-containing protein n=1 Tax=Archangium lansingense TaxID=2995310 RepID=A0ABT4AFL3_9BACT|nr:TetR family transcriptional regulator C-terminal domain-containing protein [Archangium lansinium]MCY1080478.1 TetR family transcriptional regulator C-terminal domain-containing protein [Archangium lansinium]